ncbi:hypothetical protein DWV84_02450 [Blautia sp. AF13-16]|uniref:CotH kinase family protein n=1 Tax=Blautia TaxID=572511 RepID=UPI000E46EA5C|nr:MULTISPECIES: CotH kinase family protein [unclassified Blautia]RHS21284.1 hypothetical protein DWV84_02450 [Blautia sp. AF13-16]
MKKKFSTKDIFLIALSILALTVLIFIIIHSEKKQQEEREKLAAAMQQEESGEDDGSLYAGSSKALMINEVNQSGWVELYNCEKEDLDISGIAVLVNGEKKAELTKHTRLDAGKFLTLDLDEKLGEGKENLLSLVKADGTCIQSWIVPKLTENESYGRVADGDISMGYLNATKGEANEPAEKKEKEQLEFSVPSGFYDSAFPLTISAPDHTEIYYTTDGTVPTEKSEKYTAPVTIENRSGSDYIYADSDGIGYEHNFKPASIQKGTVVRAVYVDEDGRRSEEKIRSYYVGVGGSSDLNNMPVLSVTADPLDLFDYFTGMYVSGQSYEDALARGEGKDNRKANYRNGWVKKAHIEFFESGKDMTYEGDVNLSMLTDMNITSPQKGFSAQITGSGGWEGSSLERFLDKTEKTLAIQTNKYDNAYKIRELTANKLLEETSVGTNILMPCVVFINGENWGGYMLRAPFTREFIEEQYGITGEEVVTVRNGSADQKEFQSLYDEFYNFVTGSDMSDTSKYEIVKQEMDIRSYLDYFCANMYLANAQYGQEEACIWRTVSSENGGYADGRWRWVLGSMDMTMDNGTTGPVSTASINTLLQPGVTEDAFFQSLLGSGEFRQQLKESMYRMADDIFPKEKAEAIVNETAHRIQKMAVSSYKRFFGNVKDDFYADEVDKILHFFNNRSKYMLHYTDEMIK